MLHVFRSSIVCGGLLALSVCGSSPALAQAPPAAHRSAPTPPAAELPAFLPGLWDYQRTALSAGNPKPKTTNVRICGDPSSDIQRKFAELKQKGCQFAPLTRQGKRYVSHWTCPSPGGALIGHNRVTIASERSYEDETEVRSGDQVARSKVVAKRIGDCREEAPASQAPPAAVAR